MHAFWISLGERWNVVDNLLQTDKANRPETITRVTAARKMDGNCLFGRVFLAVSELVTTFRLTLEVNLRRNGMRECAR
jgi:hypothetical protein